MKSDSFLLNKRMFSEKVSLYKNNRFTLEFKFKHLDFYNEIYYLRKIRKFDLLLSNVKKYTGSFFKKKKLNFSILLTNDGTLSQYLMHPKNKIEKEYIAITDQYVSEKNINKLFKGIFIGSNEKGRAKIVSQESKKGHIEVTMILKQGK